MGFPRSPRVIYDKNPLESVICQLRFPPILRIDSEAPAAFQEAIRDVYPLLTERTAVEIPAEIAGLLGERLRAVLGSGRAYDFAASDEQWTVSLARDFIALTSRAYRRWEIFKEHLAQPLEALLAIYKPAFFTRIGLRYRNVIRPSRLGLEDCSWAELLRPHIAAELSAGDVAQRVEQAVHDVVIALEGRQGQARIQHGLAVTKDTSETAYLIDADIFTEQRREAPNVLEVLDHFNREAGNLFRWCIEDRLHQAMGPRNI